MRFSTLVLSLLASSATAVAEETMFTSAMGEGMQTDEMTLDGTALLQQQRDLSNNNANANNNNNNANANANANNNANAYAYKQQYGEHYYNWLKNYSIRFQSCHELPQYDNQGLAFSKQTMIKFKLCPADKCGWRCLGGATYAADAKDFLPAYLESKMDYESKSCKYQNTQCKSYCKAQNGYYDQSCLATCLTNAGYSWCASSSSSSGSSSSSAYFDMEDYLTCTKLDYKNPTTGNSYYGKVYCGFRGHSLHMGIYEDASCARRVDTAAYDFTRTFGVTLPYTKDSLVSRECVTCREDANNQHYYDANDANDVTYTCEDLYSKSLKCENRHFLDVVTPNREGCRFIKRTLPAMDDANRGARKSTFTKVLAWILGLACLYLCVIACLMGKKRAKDRDIDEHYRYRSSTSSKAESRGREMERDMEKQQRRRSTSYDEMSYNGRSVGTNGTKSSRRSKSPFRYFKKNKNGELL